MDGEVGKGNASHGREGPSTGMRKCSVARTCDSAADAQRPITDWQTSRKGLAARSHGGGVLQDGLGIGSSRRRCDWRVEVVSAPAIGWAALHAAPRQTKTTPSHDFVRRLCDGSMSRSTATPFPPR
jgi:hypothetical protein